MELIPAIDILGGRVVRLRQGDFDRATSFGDDPVATARRWADAGARRLHIVDLDGAREGRAVATTVIERIVRATGVPCQLGGGLRNEDAVAAALALGVDRVVVGSALARDPDLGRRLVERHGDARIVAGVDIRAERVATDGWVGTGGDPLVLLARLVADGVRTAVVTRVERDGEMSGPDLDLYRSTGAAIPELELVASGGIGQLDDVRALADVGLHAAILGRALYEVRFSLEDAARVAAST